jgi:DNA-binding MurR/RpiR family transcriptional regulator
MADTPSSAETVLQSLTEGFGSFSPQLQRAARFLIDHPREVGVQSMRALAGKAEVHPNTLVRLAQQIGFEGYDELRERFRDFVVADGLGGFGDRARWLQRLGGEGGAGAVMAEMAGATTANLEAMWRRQSAEELEAAAEAILSARHAYVLGLGAAENLAHQFWYVARMGFDHVFPIPRRGALPIDDVAMAGPEDLLVALTFQPYRAETMDAVRLARSNGCKVLGITDSATSPLARMADRSLIAPTHTPQFFPSHAAVAALLEALVAILVARAGDEARARIERFHEKRREAGAYEEPSPLSQLG